MHKRGLCCRAVAGWVAGWLSRSCIVSKRLEIRPHVLWNSNRKLYPSFRMVPFSMTLLVTSNHIRPALSGCIATILATSLVQSRLDYVNSLLHGTYAANIHKLQCAQNSLSRVVLCGGHREQLSASMRLSNLNWLPVRKRIDFKLALTTYKILSTHQPAYLRSLLFPYEPTRALRSSSQQLLHVPTVTTDFGRRAFSYCAAKI